MTGQRERESVRSPITESEPSPYISTKMYGGGSVMFEPDRELGANRQSQPGTANPRGMEPMMAQVAGLAAPSRQQRGDAIPLFLAIAIGNTVPTTNNAMSARIATHSGDMSSGLPNQARQSQCPAGSTVPALRCGV